MKDILTGFAIILAVFFVGDLIYSEQNTCVRNENGHIGEFASVAYSRINLI